LPPYNPESERPSDQFALVSIGMEPNNFGSTVGRFRYQFEGEEDLLHLFVTDIDCGELTPEQGQVVAGFVLYELPAALVWFRPGRLSQHFYFGHELLVQNAKLYSVFG
jgi:hypothetical protein